MMFRATKHWWLVPFVLLLGVGACDDAIGPDADPEVALSFSLPTTQTGASAVPFSAAAVPVSDPSGDSLTIERVEVVLADIELKRVERVDDCDASGHGNPCREFEAGPVLIDLPLDGGAVTPFRQQIPEGDYDEIDLDLDTAEDDDSATVAFREAHPNWPEKASVRVVGTFTPEGGSTRAFDVTYDIAAEIEREFSTPITIGATQDVPLDITVAIDVERWFVDPDGGLIDPEATMTESSLRSRVHNNIEKSFDAFEDRTEDA